MATPTKQIIDALYTALSTDADLSSYVPKFYKENNPPNVMFPYIAVRSDYSYEVEALTIGRRASDEYIYTFTVEGAVKHMDAETAYYGDASNKGAVDMERDITEVLRPNFLSGLLMEPVRIKSGAVSPAVDKTGFIYVVQIEIECRIRVRRTS